jgi:hypothetical protein
MTCRFTMEVSGQNVFTVEICLDVVKACLDTFNITIRVWQLNAIFIVDASSFSSQNQKKMSTFSRCTRLVTVATDAKYNVCLRGKKCRDKNSQNLTVYICIPYINNQQSELSANNSIDVGLYFQSNEHFRQETW